MFDQLQIIDIGYTAFSDDELQRCGVCAHFRPAPGNARSECEKQEQGSCFGKPVTENGLCRMFTAFAPMTAAAA